MTSQRLNKTLMCWEGYEHVFHITLIGLQKVQSFIYNNMSNLLIIEFLLIRTTLRNFLEYREVISGPNLSEMQKTCSFLVFLREIIVPFRPKN